MGGISRALGLSRKLLIGSLVAIGVMIVPLAVLVRKRNAYWKARQQMKDAGAQWDDDATNVIDMPVQAESEAVDSYQGESEQSSLLGGGRPGV